MKTLRSIISVNYNVICCKGEKELEEMIAIVNNTTMNAIELACNSKTHRGKMVGG